MSAMNSFLGKLSVSTAYADDLQDLRGCICIDIARRNLMLITIRALRVNTSLFTFN